MYKIYTLPNCNYCEKLKDSLRLTSEPFEEICIDKDITREQFKETYPLQNTVPLIFFNGEKIGGYEDYLKRLKWSNYHNELKDKIIDVTFTKVNGEERKMICTLSENKLPKLENSEQQNQQRRGRNYGVLSAYDLEKDAWRSFRVDSIKDWKQIDHA